MTIADLQDYLNSLGCTPPLDEDGDLGKLTKAALADFKTKIPLSFRDPDGADGMPGPLTADAILFCLAFGIKPLESSK